MLNVGDCDTNIWSHMVTYGQFELLSRWSVYSAHINSRFVSDVARLDHMYGHFALLVPPVHQPFKYNEVHPTTNPYLTILRRFL